MTTEFEFYKEKEFQDINIGEISSNWKIIKMIDLITEMKNGFASGKRDKHGIVQIRMNNVSIDGKLNLNSTIKVPKPQNVEEYLLTNDDILFNNTNSIDLVGKTAIVKNITFPCVFSNHFNRVRVNLVLVYPEWILNIFLINWKKRYFESVASRYVGQASVSKDYILNMNIPLPDLKEQKNILKIIELNDKYLKIINNQIDKMELLKTGLMQELLTKGIEHKDFQDTPIGKISKSWQIKSVKDFFVVKTGTTPSTNNIEYWENGTINWITPTDLSKLNGKIYVERSERSITKKALEKTSLTLMPKKTLLISTRAPVGYVALLQESATFNQGCKGLIAKNTAEIYPEFYYYYFINNKQRLVNSSSGSTFKELSKNGLELFNIPFISFSEQEEIASTLIAIDKKLQFEYNQKEKMEKIIKNVNDLLLTGKIRVREVGS